ncbi:hypothetical protein ACFV6F_12860 [Kitasatospora phosalacinea]|uniref:hypothetical protein n=1 Tax=Kitasatospora phosalacinea TaxID=2065 RepID=UPI0036595DCF
MNDPAQPEQQSFDQDPPTSGSEPGPADGGATLLKKIERVAAWYAEQALAENRTPSPDAARLERLLAERAECAADRKAVDDADEAELERLQALYDAKLAEITGE